jgi:hypothetical protein
MGARALNAVLGLWLFFSAFLWPQTSAQRWTAWMVGILAVTAALAGGSGEERGRNLGAALGGWLILSALLLPRLLAATFWNEIFVGFAMAFLALASTAGDLRRRRGTADV